MSVNTDASFVDRMPQNVAVQFLDRLEATPEAEAFRFPRGEAWESVTWSQVGTRVSRLAAGLLAAGLEAEDRVGIISGTRYEWIVADLAIMCASGATTTVYPSTNADDTAFILADSGSRIVFAEDAGQVEKLQERRDELSGVERVVLFDGAGSDDNWVVTLDSLEEQGAAYLGEHPDAVTTTAAKIPADQLATLIYTSGTTGRPKGVRLLHRAWVYQGCAIQAQDILHTDDLQYLWLPMAHAFGKVLLSSQLACGFATAVDGRVDKIIDNLAVVKPTFMGAAPRIFEKAYARIQNMQSAAGGVQEQLFKRAFAVGVEVDKRKREHRSVPPLLKAQHALFDKLVFSKVRQRFGGRVKFFISGSAALNREIAEWFEAAGILILEGYGMTENAAGAAVNHPDDYKMGTVGTALPGSEIRIGEGEEVLLRGPHIMAGYHNNPDETAKALDDEGWLHTGDKGSLDTEGFLTITGRIKDLFKTSGGKYVAPSAIEAKFKALCPYASQFMVFGSERNFVSALVTLDEDEMRDWASSNGMDGDSYRDVVTSSKVKDLIGDYVDQLNGQLNRWETIKRFEILPADLTIESGELTPSLKVKRNVVADNNSDLIDSFYGG